MTVLWLQRPKRRFSRHKLHWVRLTVTVFPILSITSCKPWSLLEIIAKLIMSVCSVQSYLHLHTVSCSRLAARATTRKLACIERLSVLIYIPPQPLPSSFSFFLSTLAPLPPELHVSGSLMLKERAIHGRVLPFHRLPGHSN
jgi:hypothetical protein